LHAHASDIARGREDARVVDDLMSEARYNFDWNRQFELALDPDKAREFHDETLPQDVFKEAEFCSMCGPKFCSYKITPKIMEEHSSTIGRKNFGNREIKEEFMDQRYLVLKCIKNVLYPGFSKRILFSFNFVKDVEIDDDKVKVTVEITSSADEVKLQLIKDIETELIKAGADDVFVDLKAPKKPVERSNSMSG